MISNLFSSCTGQDETESFNKSDAQDSRSPKIKLNGNNDPTYPRYQELIGDTPLLDLSALANPKVKGVRILGKAEFLNPGFSMKDRIAQNILTKALASGKLRKGGTVVAASSGNTGASIAMLSAMMGLNAVIITSPKCSKEKMDCIRAYGAELIVSKPGQNYMDMEVELANEHPDWFAFDQYNNPSNPEAHWKSTGPEIWEQTKGGVTHFVMAGSTGGTVSGVGKYLKEHNPDVKIVLADPIGSIFAHYYHTKEVIRSEHKFLVEGVGKETIPGAMDFTVIDSVMRISDADAFKTCRKLASSEGILVGGSAGLNVHAAIQLANEAEEPCTIVTILCDLGIKYLSKIYNDDWLAENGCQPMKSMS